MSQINNTNPVNPSESSSPLSEARLAANRENAQKSTGPTTPEGKAKTSLNALKNGLTGTNMLFTNRDDLIRYHVHVDSYATQFQPVGPEESALVQSIADIRWKLNRIPGLEMTLLVMGHVDFLEKNPSYSTLQTERRAKEEEALAEAAKSSLLAKHRNQPLTQVPGLGFVFSEKRFATFMSRLTPVQREKLLQEAIARLLHRDCVSYPFSVVCDFENGLVTRFRLSGVEWRLGSA